MRGRIGKSGGKEPFYSEEQIETALRNNYGLLTIAAEELGCKYETIFIRIKHSDHLQAVKYSITEQHKDWAEQNIIDQIKASAKRTKKKESKLSQWYLEYQARERGYVERTELTGAEGKPIEVKVNYMAPFSDDEIELMKKQAEDFKKAIKATMGEVTNSAVE